ncbi:MAG: transpeptidase family protein [Dysgonamonadaceae bacterium]|jgi:cell division protein FtsI (penicillin-binding protein 3)|nr:transpeptidase family protein [Dysgonamonadaceae bacterium]
MTSEKLNNKIKEKYFIITALLILIVIAVLGRASYISFVEGSAWKKLGNTQTKQEIPVSPLRGNIYSSDHQLMATFEPRYYLAIDFCAQGVNIDTLNKYIEPLSIQLHKMFPNKSPAEYKKHLINGWKNREKKDAKGKIRKNRSYRLLDHYVDYIQWKEIEKMPYFEKGRYKTGLHKDTVSMRVNPYGTLALRTIGSISKEKNENGKTGQSGLELYYDSILAGEYGTAVRRKVNGQTIDVINKKPVNGKDIITTIDITIQDITEKYLTNKLKELNAESGTAVVMEVTTGEIKAITNMGRTERGYSESLRNYAVADLSEPGSTFKIISMLVALEDGLIHPDDSVDTGNGVERIAGEELKDHNANRGGYGKISAAQSIQYSSNIGIAKLILKAYADNPARFVDGIYRTGLNKDLELEIPGYAVPRIRHPQTAKNTWYKTTLPWMSFGYETRIPPIYILTFFNAIANNGKMVKPIFVKEIQENGKTIEKRKPQIINKRIASENTLNAIRQMMDSVVNHPKGTGKPAHSDYIRIAGKTGTAQISQGAAGYTAAGKMHQVSFCGFFPAENPRYSCIVVIRNPAAAGASGGQMCGTVFKQIAEEIYAQNKIPNTNILPVDTLHPLVPKVKNGRSEQSIYALKKLDIKYKDSLDGQWASSRLRNNQLVLKKGEIAQNSVPNVIGMGAKDAVYAMESSGLKVSLAGKGTVVEQSISSGTKIIKGQTVTLTLK